MITQIQYNLTLHAARIHFNRKLTKKPAHIRFTKEI